MDNKNREGKDSSAGQTEKSGKAPFCAEGTQGNEISLRYENKRQVVKSGLLGAFIGLAIIVPGVSGSAVAILFRLYEKLLYALGSLFKQFTRSVRFLLPIAAGAVIGLVPLGFSV